MKKNFFKKLSFVLALAMIVTALAPAAGVFAKAAPKLNATSVYLYLDQDGKNVFDFNIANKQTGWKYAWTSANKKVATVKSSNGLVTATGAGKTTVSVVISDKKGKEVDELTATVTVRDNIKSLTITNVPADNKLAVDQSNDFNRSYKTVAGSTTKTSGITRWVVSPSDGATITDSGVFTATKAGEYTITANAFQSTAKYTSWLADNAKYASYVTATTSVKVTVAPSMVKAAQTTLKKFDVSFDSAMVKADVEKNLAVSYMLGTTKVKEAFKSVTMSADNKTATIEMYINLTEGATYVVEYAGMKSVEFVSATTKITDVTEVAILTTTAELSKKKTLDIALYNKDRVNLAGDAELLARVTVDKNNNLASLDGKDLYMYKVGDTVTITATYHTYSYDSTGKEVGAIVGSGVVTCVEQNKAVIGTLDAYTVGVNANNFKDVKHTIFKNDTANTKKLFVKFKGKDENGDDKTTTNEVGGDWKYVSSNPNVIIVDASGNVWGAAEGTAVVVVKYNDVQVAACEITVTGKVKAATLTLDTNSIVLSRNFTDDKTVDFTVKDQLGNDYNNFTFKLEANAQSSAPTTLVNNTLGYAAGSTGNSLTFTPNGVTEGTYYYTLTVTDTADTNNKLTSWISVQVQKPSNTTHSYYRLETDKSSYDMKIGSTGDTVEKVTLSLYSYNSEGVRLAKVNVNSIPTNGSNGLFIKDSDGNRVTSDLTQSGDSLVLDLITSRAVTAVSGTPVATVVDTKKTGNWTVTAVSGTPINAISFEVKNTQPKATFTVNKTATKEADLVNAINDCFDFDIDGTAVDFSGPALDGNGYIDLPYNNGTRAQINNIYLYQTINGVTIQHKVELKGIVIDYNQN